MRERKNISWPYYHNCLSYLPLDINRNVMISIIIDRDAVAARVSNPRVRGSLSVPILSQRPHVDVRDIFQLVLNVINR